MKPSTAHKLKGFYVQLASL